MQHDIANENVVFAIFSVIPKQQTAVMRKLDDSGALYHEKKAVDAVFAPSEDARFW